jgi:hypothetical protein
LVTPLSFQPARQICYSAPNICSSLPEPCGMSCRASCDEANSPACKGKSLRCLRKCRFSYIDTSPALSARRHLTAALRYSEGLPQRPFPVASRLSLIRHTAFRHLQSRPIAIGRLLRAPRSKFDLDQKFWCRGLWGLRFNEQIFGADEQNSGRGQSD